MKYLVKFYKHRLVEGQNNALAPLLDLYALVLLYKVSDASAKTDLHTLLGIPEDAEDGTMDKFEANIRLYLERLGGNSVFGTQLFVDSRIKEENAFLQNNFHVLSSMFSSPSIRLALDKEDKHPIKGFLMHCLFQFVQDNSARVPQQGTLAVNFDKPFIVMALTKDTNIPLLMASYFSVKDEMLAMEDEEQSLAEQVAQEELANREDL
ncbi:hypothetical protein quinque_013182 [Culex quinquefasciatus]